MKSQAQISKKIDKLDFLRKATRDPEGKRILIAQIDVLKWVKDG